MDFLGQLSTVLTILLLEQHLRGPYTQLQLSIMPRKIASYFSMLQDLHSLEKCTPDVDLRLSRSPAQSASE